VQRCFKGMVKLARERRRVSRRPGKEAPVKYLPREAQ